MTNIAIISIFTFNIIDELVIFDKVIILRLLKISNLYILFFIRIKQKAFNPFILEQCTKYCTIS